MLLSLVCLQRFGKVTPKINRRRSFYDESANVDYTLYLIRIHSHYTYTVSTTTSVLTWTITTRIQLRGAAALCRLDTPYHLPKTRRNPPHLLQWLSLLQEAPNDHAPEAAERSRKRRGRETQNRVPRSHRSASFARLSKSSKSLSTLLLLFPLIFSPSLGVCRVVERTWLPSYSSCSPWPLPRATWTVRLMHQPILYTHCILLGNVAHIWQIIPL